MKKKIWIAVGIVAVILIIVGIIIYSKAVADVLPDDVDAKLMKFENLQGQRYTEMFLIGGNAITKNLIGGVYNTVGLNGGEINGNSCPQELLEKVDVDALKEQYNVLAAFKNGPRLWTLDWTEVLVGKERDFNGLKARWVTWLDIPKNIDLNKKGEAAYKKITVKRNTKFGFNKGTMIYILDDPDGNSWVMKSASLIVDPNQKFEDLKNLRNRLKPDEGWKFRTMVLEQDLVLTPDNGIAHITQDEIGNTYDRVGGPYSNFKP